MKKILACLILVTSCATVPSEQNRSPNSQSEAGAFTNRIRPFTSDGCTNFPDGIPYFSSTKWLRCCVNHDVAYWRGGSAEERRQADLNLESCVATTGNPYLAHLMFLGVRAGGQESFPTSSHWGRGWIVSRGYAPLTAEEQAQVVALSPTLPEDITQQELESRPFIRQRTPLTGNHCQDAALVHIQLALRRGFTIEEKSESEAQRAERYLKTISIKPNGCNEAFHFTFLLLRRSACTDKMNELTARGRIRLQKVEAPEHCEAQ